MPGQTVTSPDLESVLLNLAKAGARPTRAQFFGAGKANMKKANVARKSARSMIEDAHKRLKKSYLAKQAMIKAGKKPEMDDNDADDMAKAMDALQKAYGELSTMKTFMKAAGQNFTKAAGHIGQRGQEAADGSPFYDVPAGVKDLTGDQIARTGPGTTEDGSMSPILDMISVFPGKGAKGGDGEQYLTKREAALMVRAAQAEATAEALGKFPAMPVHGKRPVAFDTSTLFGGKGANADTTAAMFKGVDKNRFQSEEIDVHNGEVAKVLGNMIAGGIGGKSLFDPDFHGTAGA